jgi:hypothetical protein
MFLYSCPTTSPPPYSPNGMTWRMTDRGRMKMVLVKPAPCTPTCTIETKFDFCELFTVRKRTCGAGQVQEAWTKSPLNQQPSTVGPTKVRVPLLGFFWVGIQLSKTLASWGFRQFPTRVCFNALLRARDFRQPIIELCMSVLRKRGSKRFF